MQNYPDNKLSYFSISKESQNSFLDSKSAFPF